MVLLIMENPIKQMDDLGVFSPLFSGTQVILMTTSPPPGVGNVLVANSLLGQFGGQIGEVCHTADGSFEIRRFTS